MGRGGYSIIRDAYISFILDPQSTRPHSIDSSIDSVSKASIFTMTATIVSGQPSSAATQVLFLLRTIQQGSIILTGFVAIYFVYWHNILRDPVPLSLVGLIAAVCALNQPGCCLNDMLTICVVHFQFSRILRLHCSIPHSTRLRSQLPPPPENHHAMLPRSRNWILRFAPNTFCNQMV